MFNSLFLLYVNALQPPVCFFTVRSFIPSHHFDPNHFGHVLQVQLHAWSYAIQHGSIKQLEQECWTPSDRSPLTEVSGQLLPIRPPGLCLNKNETLACHVSRGEGAIQSALNETRSLLQIEPVANRRQKKAALSHSAFTLSFLSWLFLDLTLPVRASYRLSLQFECIQPFSTFSKMQASTS